MNGLFNAPLEVDDESAVIVGNLHGHLLFENLRHELHLNLVQLLQRHL